MLTSQLQVGDTLFTQWNDTWQVTRAFVPGLGTEIISDAGTVAYLFEENSLVDDNVFDIVWRGAGRTQCLFIRHRAGFAQEGEVRP
jgi:hypothetical protein